MVRCRSTVWYIHTWEVAKVGNNLCVYFEEFIFRSLKWNIDLAKYLVSVADFRERTIRISDMKRRLTFFAKYAKDPNVISYELMKVKYRLNQSSSNDFQPSEEAGSLLRTLFYDNDAVQLCWDVLNAVKPL